MQDSVSAHKLKIAGISILFWYFVKKQQEIYELFMLKVLVFLQVPPKRSVPPTYRLTCLHKAFCSSALISVANISSIRLYKSTKEIGYYLN